MNKGKRIDMVQGPVAINMLRFALPIILGNILQQLYNAADRIVVGQFSENGALSLAAVGATSSATALIVGIFVGVATGVNVICANLLGARKQKELRENMHTAIPVAAICGLMVALFGWVYSGPMMALLKTPADVMDKAVLYMRIYFLGIPASLLYNFGAGILRAHGDTKRPMYILFLSGIVNVVLNVVLVVFFHRDVDGVAIATAVSQLLSAILILRILFDPKDQYHLQWRQLRIHKKQLLAIIRVGVPSGLGSAVFSISNVILQSSVNSFNSAAIIAGKTAAIDVTTLIYQIQSGMAATCVSFAGQCYGARNYKRIDKLTLTGTLLCWGMEGVCIALCCIFPEQIISLFNTDPEVIQVGKLVLLINALGYIIYIPSEIFLGCMRGMRRSVMPTVLNLLGVCLPRIIWVYFIFPLNPTVFLLYMCYPVSWGISTLLQGAYYVLERRKIDRKQMQQSQ